MIKFGDVQPQNFGVHTTWRKAKDRDTWHQVVNMNGFGDVVCEYVKSIITRWSKNRVIESHIPAHCDLVPDM